MGHFGPFTGNKKESVALEARMHPGMKACMPPPGKSKVVAMLEAAIEDELQGIEEYGKLVEIIHPDYKRIIQRILDDEREHLARLKEVLRFIHMSKSVVVGPPRKDRHCH